MKIFRALLFPSLTALLCVAASGQTVTSAFDKEYGLSRLNTYRFVDEQRDKSDPLASDTLSEKKIKDALEDELEDSGRHAPPEGATPDFLVSFHAKTEDKTAERGVSGGGYVRGILVVDFYDAATKRLVWRGIATGPVGREALDLQLAEELVKNAAKMLMEQFGRDVLAF
jgi:hypothetical protein